MFRRAHEVIHKCGMIVNIWFPFYWNDFSLWSIFGCVAIYWWIFLLSLNIYESTKSALMMIYLRSLLSIYWSFKSYYLFKRIDFYSDVLNLNINLLFIDKAWNKIKLPYKHEFLPIGSKFHLLKSIKNPIAEWLNLKCNFCTYLINQRRFMFAQHWRQTLPYVLLFNLASSLCIYIFLRVTTSTPSSVSWPENRTWPQALGPQIAWAKLHEMPLKNVCVLRIRRVFDCSLWLWLWHCHVPLWLRENKWNRKQTFCRAGGKWVGGLFH